MGGWVEKSQTRCWQEIETSCITDTLTRCGCQVTVASVVPGQLQAGCASGDECATCARSPLPPDWVNRGQIHTISGKVTCRRTWWHAACPYSRLTWDIFDLISAIQVKMSRGLKVQTLGSNDYPGGEIHMTPTPSYDSMSKSEEGWSWCDILLRLPHFEDTCA